MDNNIEKLIGKYFEGETSLREEEIVREYFSKGNIKDCHKMYAPMFAFFKEEREKQTHPPKKRNISIYRWISAAAVLLLLISIPFVWNSNTTETEKTYVYIDGKKISDSYTISDEILNSLMTISSIEEDIIDSQISVLDLFIE